MKLCSVLGEPLSQEEIKLLNEELSKYGLEVVYKSEPDNWTLEFKEK